MRPKLKPPGTKRLKLKFDILLSNFAFKFSLRRYNTSQEFYDEVSDLFAEAIMRYR